MSIKEDIARNHSVWARDDVQHIERTVTGRDEVFGDATTDDNTTVISAVFTEKSTELESTVGGGVVTGDAELRVLPDVSIDEGDGIKIDNKWYRVAGVAAADDGNETVEYVAALKRQLGS